MIFVGLEKIGFVLLFCSPDEFYVQFVKVNEPITLSSVSKTDTKPTKNEVLANSKFIISYNAEFVICQIKEDLKYDEIFCQVSLCNTDIVLKVDYRKLIFIRPEDIVKHSISLKFNDFTPCFPNQWNSNLILKLKKSMNYNIMIFQFKSFMVDPSDGRYPVEVLNLADRQSLNERFINDNLATKSSENFKAKLENTFNEVFNGKKTKDIFYQVSVPLVKNKPKPRANISSAKVLNASAQIFIPNKDSELNQSIGKPTEKKPNNPPLSSNIVHMFSEMYRNRQSNNNNSNNRVPFRNYQSVFPLYGGVDFSSKKIQSEKKNPKIPPSNTYLLTSSPENSSPIVAAGNPIKIEPSLSYNSTESNQSPKIPHNNLQFPTDPIRNVTSSDYGVPVVYSAPPDFYQTSNSNSISVSSNSKSQPTLSESPLVSELSPTGPANSLLASLSNLSMQSPPPKSQIYVSQVNCNPASVSSSSLPYQIPPGNFSPYSVGASNYLWRKPVFPDMEYMRRNPAPEYYIIKAPSTSSYPIFGSVDQHNLFPFNFSIPPPPDSVTLINANNNNLPKPVHGTESSQKEPVNLIIQTPNYNESGWGVEAPHFVPEPSQPGNFHIQPLNLIYYRPN